MSTHHEVERLRKVYHGYRESKAVQAKWSQANPGNQAIVQERTHALKQLLQTVGFLPLTNYRILDVGCGSGDVLAGLVPWGALPDNLYGVDLLPDLIAAAKQRFPEFHLQHGNAEQLDFQDASFDLVLLFTVFSSILDERMAYNVAREVRRVLRSGGAIAWYDFRYRNPWNFHTRPMTKRRVCQFFPDFETRLCTITLLPPLARRLGLLTHVLYPLLAAIPLLQTHYMGLLIKPRWNSNRQCG